MYRITSAVSYVHVVFLLFLCFQPALSSFYDNRTDCDATKCIFTISDQSLEYFHSLLIEEDPKFVKFNVLLPWNKTYNATPESFQPGEWVWTYNSSRGMYPYLYWNMDFGVLSFGLLEVKTLRERPNVYMDVQSRDGEECVVTYGSPDTTNAMSCAFKELLGSFQRPKYQYSYYCFLAERPGVRDTFEYTAALYLLYPVDYINYNCCVTGYSYMHNVTTSTCLNHQMSKWIQCTVLPYVLGIILFLYVPIIFLRLADALSKDIRVIPGENELIGADYDSSYESHILDGDGWVYLKEHTPYGISDCLSCFWCGLDRSHPIMVSRIRRFVWLILIPTPLVIQMLLYNFNWEPGLLQKLIRHGTPMGFLTLLADRDGDKYFVPAFGGGVAILLAYGVTGLVLMVCPYSLKQIFEEGVPKYSNTNESPLCLGIWEIQDMSMLQVKSNPGYGKCADICKCSIYLIFSRRFWIRVVAIQSKRVSSCLFTFCTGRKILYLVVPFYFVLCLIEAILCIVWYGFPLLRSMHCYVRGAIKMLSTKFRCSGQSNLLSMIMNNPIGLGLVSIVLCAMTLVFAYSLALIFIQSFTFVFQILMFGLVAVIVYPAISFGYVVFIVVLAYYISHMIRGFGDTYLTLLSEAVEISQNLDGEINFTSTFGNTLEVSNIRAHGITKIKIEGRPVCLPQNFFQSIAQDTHRKPKIKLKDNTYGIPKGLFRLLIQRHKPENQQALKIVFQVLMIVLLLTVTMSISAGFATGPSSEISDVMHLIFIVSIGALPKVLEVALTTANESVIREIESRQIEQTIVKFWQREEMGNTS